MWYFPFQCSEGHQACKKQGVGLLVTIWLEFRTSIIQLSPPLPSSMASIKSRVETSWYQLTQVHLEKWPLKRSKREIIIIIIVIRLHLIIQTTIQVFYKYFVINIYMTQFNFLDNALNVIILFAITVCFQKLHNYASTILICNRLRISKKKPVRRSWSTFPSRFHNPRCRRILPKLFHE